MADHSVGARDESNGSEASEALMFCFDNAFPEMSCFVVDLVLWRALARPPATQAMQFRASGRECKKLLPLRQRI